jgi:hypothetical protein
VIDVRPAVANIAATLLSHPNVQFMQETTKYATFCCDLPAGIHSEEHLWSQAQALNTMVCPQRQALDSSLILLCNEILCASQMHQNVTILPLLRHDL